MNELQLIPGAEKIARMQENKKTYDGADNNMRDAWDHIIRQELVYLYIAPVDHRIRELCWRVLYKQESAAQIAEEPAYRDIGAEGIRTLCAEGLKTIDARRIPCGRYKHKTSEELDYIAESSFLLPQLGITWDAKTRKEDEERAERVRKAEREAANRAAIAKWKMEKMYENS